MGLFGRLFRGAPREIEDLAIDLGALTVCGLGRLDTRASIEARLGPPEKVRNRVQLEYPQIGLLLTVGTNDHLEGLAVYFFNDPALAARYRWRPAGEPSEAWAIAALGSPAKREVDDEEIMLEWQRGPIYIGIDFFLDGRISDVMVDFV